MRTEIVTLNSLSHHVFRWICYSNFVDVNSLVEEACKMAEDERDIPSNDEGEIIAVREHLAGMLEERLEEWCDEWIRTISNERFYNAEEAELLIAPDAVPEHALDFVDLCAPLTAAAWQEISPWHLSVAILSWKGVGLNETQHDRAPDSKL